MIERKKLLIIGPAPQNVGGVSMHIRRLSDAIADKADIDYIDEGRKRWPGIFNLRSLNLFEYSKKMARADIVHIHSVPFVLRLFNMTMARLFFKKPIVTIHFNPTVQTHPKMKRAALTLASKVIAVNNTGYEFLKKGHKADKYFHMPAFLPPAMDKEPALDPETQTAINNIKAKGGKIAVSNAWHLVDRGGEELYGFDLCIEALKQLKKENENIYIIFVVAEPEGCLEMWQRLSARVREDDVADRMVVIGHPVSFVKLAEQADMVIRATKADGDALTVREALWLGKPCIASDAIERPEGTVVFKSRDAGALATALKRASQCAAKHVEFNPIQFYTSLYGI